MSVGNSSLETYSRFLITMLQDNPNKVAIIYSYFTQRAIKEILEEIDQEIHNLVLNENIYQALDAAFKLLTL